MYIIRTIQNSTAIFVFFLLIGPVFAQQSFCSELYRPIKLLCKPVTSYLSVADAVMMRSCWTVQTASHVRWSVSIAGTFCHSPTPTATSSRGLL